jgi:hypothetical protein
MPETTFIFGDELAEGFQPPYGALVTMTWEAPATERVLWYAARGRRDAATGHTITSVQHQHDEGPHFGTRFTSFTFVDDDGTIEVLVEDQ